MRLDDFEKGMRVIYVPNHADGDANHKDCQKGVVSSKNDAWVFVKYDNLDMKMITGDEPYTANATSSDNLLPIGRGGV